MNYKNFILFSFISFIMHGTASAKPQSKTLSMQYQSFTANAGGQEAWSLRLSMNDRIEYSIFANKYLTAENYPLLGAIYSLRLPILSRKYPIRSFTQLGAGLTNIGPVVELLWSFTPLWIFRIDFSTHFYFTRSRMITWSYPLWVGISVPF